MKKTRALILLFGVAVTPFSAFAFNPLGLFPVELENMRLFVVLSILGLIMIAAMVANAARDTEMTRGLSQLGYLQRFANCNLYADGFVNRAIHDPDSIWQTYGEIWQEKPHLFNAKTSDVMENLQKRYGSILYGDNCR